MHIKMVESFHHHLNKQTVDSLKFENRFPQYKCTFLYFALQIKETKFNIPVQKSLNDSSVKGGAEYF
jgi:hypothetical protein